MINNNCFLPLIDFKNSKKRSVSNSKKNFQLSKLQQIGKSMLMKNNKINIIKTQCNEQDSKFLIQKYYEPLALPKRKDKNNIKNKKAFLIKKDSINQFINLQKYKNNFIRKSSMQKLQGSINIGSLSRRKDKIKHYTQDCNADQDINTLLFPKYKNVIKMESSLMQKQQKQVKLNERYAQKTIQKIAQMQKYKSLFLKQPQHSIISHIYQQNPQIEKYQINKQKYAKIKNIKKQESNEMEKSLQKIILKKNSIKSYILLSSQITNNQNQSKAYKQQGRIIKKQTHYGLCPWGQKSKDNFTKFH